jgi:hypothetical protein
MCVLCRACNHLHVQSMNNKAVIVVNRSRTTESNCAYTIRLRSFFQENHHQARKSDCAPSGMACSMLESRDSVAGASESQPAARPEKSGRGCNCKTISCSPSLSPPFQPKLEVLVFHHFPWCRLEDGLLRRGNGAFYLNQHQTPSQPPVCLFFKLQLCLSFMPKGDRCPLFCHCRSVMPKAVFLHLCLFVMTKGPNRSLKKSLLCHQFPYV